MPLGCGRKLEHLGEAQHHGENVHAPHRQHTRSELNLSERNHEAAALPISNIPISAVTLKKEKGQPASQLESLAEKYHSPHQDFLNHAFSILHLVSKVEVSSMLKLSASWKATDHSVN